MWFRFNSNLIRLLGLLLLLFAYSGYARHGNTDSGEMRWELLWC